MKLFDVDWATVLRELDLWDALTLPARTVLLHELKTHGYVPELRFEPHLAEIVDSGIAVYEPAKHRLWLGDQRRALVKVLRAMGRHRLFYEGVSEVDEHQMRPALLRYMEEHFTGDEVQRIASSALRSSVYANRLTLAPFVVAPGWVAGLLDAKDDAALFAWADSHGLSSAAFVSDGIATLLDLQVLVETLLRFPDGLPLRDLMSALERRLELPDVAVALHVGLKCLTIFAGMSADDLEPTIGLWPPLVRELTRAPATPPRAVKVKDTFALAVHMEDMTTLLATIVASPVRLRANDGAVFARSRAEIEKRLIEPPVWVGKILGDDRVDKAVGLLQAHRFVDITYIDANPHLHPTPAGAHWLALGAHDRLAAIVEPLRRSKEKNPRLSYEVDTSASFFPYSLPFYQAPKSLNLRAEIVRAFLQARDQFIPVSELLEYATREDNPLVAALGDNAGGKADLRFHSGYADPTETARGVWGEMMGQFLTNRLIGLGGATLGVDESGRICFSLTDVGLYLLGSVDTFDYGAGLATGDVVIQPNFDVVFLGAAPAVEAELARFSERVGVAPGHVFRITRASVLAAAETGAGVGDVIGALTRASSRPIPRNVQHEIAGWMAAVRRATLRRTELLECADADVAARIVTLLGAGVRQLTPVVLELPDATPAARASMMRKLRAGGVFIDEAVAAEGPRRARHR